MTPIRMVLTAAISVLILFCFSACGDDLFNLISSGKISGEKKITSNSTTLNISRIPAQWIESAKANLHIMYGHTSHGEQIPAGMNALAEYHGPAYAFNNGGSGGALDFREGDGYGSGDMDHDAGYYPNWVNETRSYLGASENGRGSNHPDINVIMWAWCGQVSGASEQSLIEEYLAPMSQLEADYQNVDFIYMTGHLDGGGANGNLHLRNQQIRNYCEANNKILFDFADIESYDPNGLVNYMALNANDNCVYDSSGTSVNWAQSWINRHPNDELTLESAACGGCAHSQSLNCVQKGRAFWWLLARISGWSGR